jgi:hypothetical protein
MLAIARCDSVVVIVSTTGRYAGAAPDDWSIIPE